MWPLREGRIIIWKQQSIAVSGNRRQFTFTEQRTPVKKFWLRHWFLPIPASKRAGERGALQVPQQPGSAPSIAWGGTPAEIKLHQI